MTRALFASNVKPERRLRVRRWFGALLLGLSAWWILGWWLEPRPLWQNEATSVGIICEDSSGRWLATSEYKSVSISRNETKSEVVAFSILDTATGQKKYTLLNPEQEPVNTVFRNLQLASFRICGDTLWRCTLTKTGKDYCYQLRAWHFTDDDKEHVVLQWNPTTDDPFELHFSENGSPFFILHTEWPWHVGLSTVLADHWSGLVQLLALQTDKKWTTAIMPWLRVYQLPTEPGQQIAPMTSWLLPPLRWSKPAIAGDLSWIAFGDSALPAQWQGSSGQRFSQPGGLLLYDVMTGRQRLDISIPKSPKQTLAVNSHGHLIRVRDDADLSRIWWYHGQSSKQLSWPKEISVHAYLGAR